MQIVIQAANAFKSGTENLQWLNENEINYTNYSNYGTKWPVPGYTNLSSPFGKRTDPISGKKNSFHSGIDIPAPQDTPVCSPTNGIVVENYWSDYTGNTLVIRDKTYDYIFMHLYTVDVKEGQEVVEGQHIRRSWNNRIVVNRKSSAFWYNKRSIYRKKLYKSVGSNCKT